LSLEQIQITVKGLPAPQGSKVAFKAPRTGRIVVKESSDAKVKAWRQGVAGAALAAIAGRGLDLPIRRPVRVSIMFALPRPKDHYGTGRNAGQVKPSAPLWPTTYPDLSKLIRSTEDALTTAGIWADDAQVVICVASKDYAGQVPGLDLPGALITITPIDRPAPVTEEVKECSPTPF
jgi:crossover junction endodeoxyribonuclease RusA